MKVLIYTRVSTDKQNHDSQLQDLREYCTRRGWTEVEEMSDVISGAKSGRKGLDRLMRAVRRGRVDVVVCFKLDRLGRSLSHPAQLIDEFNTHKVALVMPAQGIDTSEGNPAGKLQLDILCAVAEFEMGEAFPTGLGNGCDAAQGAYRFGVREACAVTSECRKQAWGHLLTGPGHAAEEVSVRMLIKGGSKNFVILG